MSWVITGSEKTPVDPQFTSVSLLLHGNGTNGSTTITDSSPSPKTVTAFGNAQISTAQGKFGEASIAFDGAGDYLSIPSNVDFAFAGDATIEAWFRTSSIASIQHIYGQTTGLSGLVIYINTGGIIGVQTGTLAYRETSAIVTVDTWHFLSITKSSNTYRVWLNGIERSYSGQAGTMLSTIPQNALNIGATATGTSGFNGYIDDFRVTKGVARYTANFTPPTAPFPDI
jgi:hypothetical protein